MEDHVNKMIGQAADKIIGAIAKHHVFDLPINLATSEGRRLLNFVELCEKPDKYPELSTMDVKLFATARGEIRHQIIDALKRAK